MDAFDYLPSRSVNIRLPAGAVGEAEHVSRQDQFVTPVGVPLQGALDDTLLQLRIRLRLDEIVDVEAKLLRASARRQPTRRELIDLASRIYDARRERDRMLSDKSFGEPAWDMLLALYCLGTRGIALGVTSLAHAANISEASGGRWQKILVEEDLIEKGPCVNDARQQLVRLTDRGRQLIETYLSKLYFCEVPSSDLDADQG